MAAVVAMWTGVEQTLRHTLAALGVARTPAGALVQRPQELAAGTERVGDSLVALERRRGPQLAADLGHDQLAPWDRGLVDLSQVPDRRCVTRVGPADRHRQALGQAPQAGRRVGQVRHRATPTQIIDLVLSGP